jgi:hypothetical protein
MTQSKFPWRMITTLIRLDIAAGIAITATLFLWLAWR